MKTFWKILLYVIGFPAMLVLVYLESRQVIEYGESYGILVYGGVLVAALVMVLYIVVGLITWGISRKAKTRKAIRICTIVLVLFSLLLTTGVWTAIDFVLPDILSDATDGTIEYEDVREAYNERAEYHRWLLDTFIKQNVANGNLKALSEEEYLAQGYQNEEVVDLIHQQFASLDEDGYATFDGPWLPLANDSRMTINVVVHLIIDEREISDPHPFLLYGEGRTGDEVTAPVTWTIMDMQEGSMSVDLSGLLGNEAIASILEMSLVKNLINSNLPDLLGAVNEIVADPALAGSYIYIGLDLEKGDLTITPTSESRGVHDYMHMAWFNSNNLLFLVISLFPARKIFFFYSAIVVMLSLAIGIIRERQYKKNFIKLIQPEKAASTAVAAEAKKEAPLPPYLQAYYDSKADFNKRIKTIQ